MADDKRALIVIDMQNDYLWAKRQAKFDYPTQALAGAVNDAIDVHRHRGDDILYVLQIFPNIPTNRWLIGFSIEGTEGARLYAGLEVASELLFEKNLQNAFTAKRFRTHISREGYGELVLCGLDECGCVGATARAAAKRGIPVSIIESATASRFSPERVRRTREGLLSMGVRYR